VTYESRRRPRIRIRTIPQPEVSEPVPEAVR
jgi:hypothetical protein